MTPRSSVLNFLRSLTTSEPGDHTLLDQYRRERDEAAFAALVRRHGSLVLGVCRRVLRDAHAAEDAFQATFLALARNAGSIRQKESLDGWLYKVAYRLALRLRARTERQRVTESRPRAPEPSPPDLARDLTLGEISDVLDEELQLLPENYRLPLILCYLTGLTLDEAAQKLGWTPGSVKGRLERGRQMLRIRLERRGLTFPAALLTLLLTQAAGTAAPSALVAATVKAVVAYTTGASAGVVADHVRELAESVSRFTPHKLVAASVALVAAAGLGLGITVALDPAAPAPPAAAPVAAVRADLPDPDTQVLAPPKEKPQDHTFPDVARASGLDAIAAEQIRGNPKWQIAGLHLADLDGDGHLDLFMSAYGQGRSVVALNDGAGRFRLAPGVDLGDRGLQLACDVTGSGRLDFTTLTPGGMTEWWTNHSRPGQLDFRRTKIVRGGDTGRRQAVIDINRDGKVDWVRGTRDEIVFDLGDGKGGFTRAAGLFPVGEIYSGFELLCLPVDVNGDGFIDFLVETGHSFHNKLTGNSRVYLNDGMMGFRDATEECGLPPWMSVAIKGVCDVNQDGFPDLIVFEGKKPEVYLNDGKGRFTKLPGAITGMERAVRPTAASWGMAVMTDIDNDGIPDLLWNGQFFLWALRGTGGGRFEYANARWGIKDLDASKVDGGLCFGDIDGDGRLDIVGYSGYSPPNNSPDDQRTFAAYRNELPPKNWLRVRPVGPQGNRNAAGAKVRLYAPGTRQLLWYEQVAVYDTESAQSYYSHVETERHYGLGSRPAADVEVEFYPSGKTVRVPNVPANTTVRVPEEAP